MIYRVVTQIWANRDHNPYRFLRNTGNYGTHPLMRVRLSACIVIEGSQIIPDLNIPLKPLPFQGSVSIPVIGRKRRGNGVPEANSKFITVHPVNG